MMNNDLPNSPDQESMDPKSALGQGAHCDNTETDKDRLDELANQSSTGIVGEFIYFLKTNKRWWLTPIVLVLLLVGVLIVLSGTAAAPFLYTFW